MKIVIYLKVKSGRQRLEKGLLCIFQAIGSIPLQRYNQAQRSELKQEIQSRVGFLSSVTVVLPAQALGLLVLCRAKLLQSCLTLCNPMDCSLLGCSVLGILQARLLE